MFYSLVEKIQKLKEKNRILKRKLASPDLDKVCVCGSKNKTIKIAPILVAATTNADTFNSPWLKIYLPSGVFIDPCIVSFR